MKVYFKNKLGVTSTVKLENNYTTEKFVREIQGQDIVEKVRVSAINSLCTCGTDLTDVLLQNMNKEITLVNETKLDDSLSHINALYEEVRFKYIQRKVLAKVKKDIEIFPQPKSDLLENNGQNLTYSETR